MNDQNFSYYFPDVLNILEHNVFDGRPLKSLGEQKYWERQCTVSTGATFFVFEYLFLSVEALQRTEAVQIG